MAKFTPLMLAGLMGLTGSAQAQDQAEGELVTVPPQFSCTSVYGSDPKTLLQAIVDSSMYDSGNALRTVMLIRDFASSYSSLIDSLVFALHGVEESRLQEIICRSGEIARALNPSADFENDLYNAVSEDVMEKIADGYAYTARRSIDLATNLAVMLGRDFSEQAPVLSRTAYQFTQSHVDDGYFSLAEEPLNFARELCIGYGLDCSAEERSLMESAYRQAQVQVDGGYFSLARNPLEFARAVGEANSFDTSGQEVPLIESALSQAESALSRGYTSLARGPLQFAMDVFFVSRLIQYVDRISAVQSQIPE